MATRSSSGERRSSFVSAPLSSSQRIDWLGKPLCRRYQVADFRALHLPVCSGAVVKEVRWCWALGQCKPGESEILGAWPSDAALVRIGQDLHERGVECIAAVAVHERVDPTVGHQDAAAWLSGEVGSLTNGLFVVRAVSAQYRDSMRAAVVVAESLQTNIKRSIKRRRAFADEAEAAAFFAQRLQSADRRFWAT